MNFLSFLYELFYIVISFLHCKGRHNLPPLQQITSILVLTKAIGMLSSLYIWALRAWPTIHEKNKETMGEAILFAKKALSLQGKDIVL